jgi:ATP-dependent helicase YprA (DUF1998 family)
MLNPVELANQLLEDYQRYLGTTFPIRGVLRERFLEELARDEALMKGPVLEATPPFKAGRSLLELTTAGLASPGFETLAKDGALDLARPLYLHQDRAFTAIRGAGTEAGRNAIVATGTGSGKTESFLLPIVDSLLAEREAGTLELPGVRALLLYPMNALANDQLKRLRHLLAAAPDITFGRYTGETRHNDKEAMHQFETMFPDEPWLDNELKSREAMQSAPPHILLTNYAMLEYLLLRPEDTVFFDGPTARHWRFLVLDEVHTYNGAMACDVAMLLRRLKDRIVQSEPGRLRCIGTSATLGDGEKDAELVAQFARDLFGEAFQAHDLILAEREALHMAHHPTWGRGHLALYQGLNRHAVEGPEVLAAIAKAAHVPETVIELALREAGDTPMLTENQSDAAIVAAEPLEDDPWAIEAVVADAPVTPLPKRPELAARRFLWHLLAGDQNLHDLRTSLADGPKRLSHLTTDWPGEEDAAAVIPALVELAVQARLSDRELPILPARYHLFFRALEGVFVSFDHHTAAINALKLERCTSVEVDGLKQRAFELSACRRCGEAFLVGRQVLKRHIPCFEQLNGTDDRLTDNAAQQPELLFRWHREALGEANEDDDVLNECDSDASSTQEAYRMCLECGALSATQDARGVQCGCANKRIMSLTRCLAPKSAKAPPGRRCPACHYLPKQGKAVSTLSLGQDAPVAVLATTLFQSQPPSAEPSQATLPAGGRKLIVFSDSRQDAAYFAPYLQRTYDTLLERRMLMHCFDQQPESRALSQVVAALAQQPDLPVFGDAECQTHAGREKRAWTWVMQEFRKGIHPMSLEGVGLLGFHLSPDSRITPSEQALTMLARFFGKTSFTEAEYHHLVHNLLLGLRAAGACTFPDKFINPSDAAFEPINRHIFCWGNESNSALGIISWKPSAKRLNARLDYLLRLAVKHRPNEPEGTLREEAGRILGRLWQFFSNPKNVLFKYVTLPKGQGDAYQLDHTRWHLRALTDDLGQALVPLWRCTHCRQLTANGLFDVCPRFRCAGKLESVEALDTANHYRNQYSTLKPLPLSCEEHTAQLEKTQAAKCQQRFIKGEVNILSCSTTFELGVDVGELQTVLMRNVPPETANYLQRAGRAGRRADSAALVVTYAQRRAHDLHYFQTPEKMVGGRMRPPSAHIRNVELVLRHIYAVAFSELFKKHQHPSGGLLPEVKHFFETSDGIYTGPTLMTQLLSEPPMALLAALKRIVPAELHDEKGIGLANWEWVTGLLDPATGHLPHAAELVQADIALYESLKRQAHEADRGGEADYYKALLNTVRRRPLLPFLGAHRLLPKYGFPIHSVELEVLQESEEARRLELNRDLRLAIGDYAPGSQVVAAGKVWQSYGLKRVANREWPTASYVACDCGWLEKLRKQDPSRAECGHCGAALPRPRNYVVPEFGFVTSRKISESVGDSRPQRGYASKVYFTDTQVSQGESALELRPVGTPALASGMSLSLASTRRGQLMVVNKGKGRAGFWICNTCGAGFDKANHSNGHKTPLDKPCKGWLKPFDLGHDFSTDVLELRFGVPFPATRGFWLSLTYALLEGASRHLQIKRDDLDGCLYYPGRDPSIILFDNVPGGAGHVRHIEDAIVQVIEAAFDVVNGCQCDSDGACYECLLSYRNQTYHSQLSRAAVRDYLENLREACFKASRDGSYTVQVPNRANWLAQMMRQANTIKLATPRLSLTSDTPPVYGVPDWFEVLRAHLMMNRHVTLALPTSALPRINTAAGAQMVQHLKVLLDKGLKLYELSDAVPLPVWPVVLEDSQSPRVVAWQTDESARLEGLSPTTGQQGIRTSIDPETIKHAGDGWTQTILEQGREITVSDARFNSPSMRFKRVARGHRTTIWEIMREHFKPDDVRLTVRDPYIIKGYQFQNIRALAVNLEQLRGETASELPITVITDYPSANHYNYENARQTQQNEQRHLEHEFRNRGVTVTIAYEAFHDREIHITRADGSLTTVLLGGGLDMLNGAGYTRNEVYLAAFDTHPSQTR